MYDDLKVCPNCNTINSVNVSFCRQCGFDLQSVHAQAENLSETTAVNDNKEYAQQADYSSNVISEEEFMAYIGKSQKRFMPSFRQFFTGRKASFSPLVFLLSWLISPIVGAFWFLHRKMYKAGAVILAVSILLTSVGVGVACYNTEKIVEAVLKSDIKISVSGHDYSYYNNDYYYYDDDYYYFNSDTNDDLGGFEIYDAEHDEYVRVYGINKNDASEIINILFSFSIWTMVFGALNLIFALVLGFLAKYLYFKSAVKNITVIKQKNPANCLNHIAMAGGTNPAVWVVALVLVMIAFLITFVVFGLHLTNEILKYIN